MYIPVNTALAGFSRQMFGINYPLPVRRQGYPGQDSPTVNVPNFCGLAGGPYPSHSLGPIWTGADTVTKVWGNHTIKAGFTL